MRLHSATGQLSGTLLSAGTTPLTYTFTPSPPNPGAKTLRIYGIYFTRTATGTTVNYRSQIQVKQAGTVRLSIAHAPNASSIPTTQHDFNPITPIDFDIVDGAQSIEASLIYTSGTFTANSIDITIAYDWVR